MWFLLSCLSAASNAGYSVGIKFLPGYSGIRTAAISHCFCGLIVAATIFLYNLKVPTHTAFVLPTAITVILNVVAVIMLLTAITKSAISVSLPFLSITPALTAVLAFLMTGETMSPLSIAGLVMIVAGTFTIEARSFRDFFVLGGARVFQDRGVLLVCCVAVIFGLSSVYDKEATLASDPLTFATVSLAARGVLFLPILVLLLRFRSANRVMKISHLLLFAVMGVMLFSELLAQVIALTDVAVANVVAVKRLSMLATSIIGFLVFREPFTLARLAGVFIMIAGSIVIYFGQ